MDTIVRIPPLKAAVSGKARLLYVASDINRLDKLATYAVNRYRKHKQQ